LAAAAAAAAVGILGEFLGSEFIAGRWVQWIGFRAHRAMGPAIVGLDDSAHHQNYGYHVFFFCFSF
jgi:hypothetical protein